MAAAGTSRLTATLAPSRRWQLPRLGVLGMLLGWLIPFARAEPPATPATLPRPLSEYFRQTWTSRDGLPHSLVNSIAQDSQGYLWFATWEGVARYNGREFHVFDRERVPVMLDHGFRTIAVGHQGVLWFGSSRGGIVRYAEGGWSTLSRADGLAQDELMVLREAEDGSLWIGYESAGVDRRFPDGRIERFQRAQGLPSDVVYSLALDSDQRVWVGTAAGLALIDGGGVRAYGHDLGLRAEAVFDVHVDPGLPLLVGTEQGAFILEDGEFRPLAEGLPRDSIQHVYRDRVGHIWIGTVSHGVFRLSPAGLERIGSEFGLPNSRVATLFEDREGSMWVGTNGGLMRLRDASFSNLGVEHGLADDYVRALLAHPEGGLWVGSSSGLDWVSGSPAVVSSIQELRRSSVLSLAPSADGSLWVGTYSQGVLRLRGGQVVERYDSRDGLSANQIRAIVEARDGSLWVGSNRGLSQVRGDGIRRYSRADGLPREFIISLHEDRQGTLWIGTANGLVRREHDGRLTPIDLPALASVQDVFGFAEDAEGALWVASDRGLLRLWRGQAGRLGYAQGLPIEAVFQVVPDRIGNLWLSSNRGVLRLSLQQAREVLAGERPRVDAEWFNELDGMATAQCNGGSGPAAVLRRDGSVSVATSKGVASVQPDRLSQLAQTVPSVVIEDMLVEDVPQRLREFIELPAGTRRIELHYAGLSFLMPEKIVYRYRLEGFDEAWVERGSRRIAQFTNLQPGTYRFRVAASHRHGDWSSVEASVQFRIPPFFWQRSEFWLLLAGLLGLAVVGLYRLRMAQVRRGEVQLRALVEERTQDLRAQTERLLEADREKSLLLARIRAQSEAFERQAREDGLTGLSNRRAFDEAMAHEFARARRQVSPLSLILLDIDWFKRINDGYSHAAGDAALKAVARALRDNSREIDAVARYGGEEFAVLCPDTGLNEALGFAERLRAAVAAIDCEPFAAGLSITISLGVAEATGLSHHERLVSRADAALYRAKEGGRNQVCG